ncbi:MAG: hypothetical protein WD005_05725 [Haliea sp.]
MKTSMPWETPSTIFLRDLRDHREKPARQVLPDPWDLKGKPDLRDQQGPKGIRGQPDLRAHRAFRGIQDPRARQESQTLVAALTKLFAGMTPPPFGYVLPTHSPG